MDSGTNSASLQSSSGGVGVGGGGDEEYDSRAGSDSFSSAFHTQNSSSSSMFDPFANYFNPISRPHPHPPPPPSHNYTPPHSLFNLDTDWSKTLRSDHNNHPMLLTSSDQPSSYSNNSLSFSTGGVSFPSSAPAEHGAVGNVSITTTTTGTAADQPITQPARNPKKRSRASRRAPTTVLTTDTTNFRAMVQEFTGIPAPPFTSSYLIPPRSRFDLFASAHNSSLRSAAAATASNNNNPLNISQPPNYLRRPFPQKIQPPPFLSPSSASSSSSSSSSSLMLSCLANNIASTTTSGSNSTINNYQLSSELGLLKPQLPSGVANSVTQSSNLFSSIQQNSILTSLLQSSQRYPIVSKDQEHFQMQANNSQLKIGSVLEEYSMNSAQHGHLLSGLPNLISPEQAAASSRNVDNSTINAAIFHGDKETVASRGGEGMVESWIRSSD